MADYGGADAGSIVVNLTLNTGKLEAGVDKANKQLKSMGSVLAAEFSKSGGYIGAMGEAIGNVGNNLKKVFGKEAPAAMQKFGGEIQKALGLSNSQVTGLAQSLQGVEGALKVIGIAARALVSPIGVAALMLGGLVAAWGAFKQAVGEKWLADRKDDFSFGLGAIKMAATGRADEGMKQVRWGDIGQSARDASIARYTDLSNRALDPKSPALTGSEADELARLRSQIPNSVIKGDNSGGGIDFEKAFKESYGTFEKSFQAGLGDAGKKLADLISKFGVPSASEVKKDAEQNKKDLLDAYKANKEAIEAQVKAEEEAWKTYDSAIIAEGEDLADFNEQNKKGREQQAAIWADQERAEKERLSKYEEQTRAEEQAYQARLSAFAQGKFGTAYGVGGIAGTTLDQVGSAAAGQSQYFGGVLQGAAQGSSAGPYGALAGAIIALVTQTEAFAKIIEGLDEILGGVVNVLDAALGPVGEGVSAIGSALGSVLGLIGAVVNFTTALDPMSNMVNDWLNGLKSIFDTLNAAANWINEQVEWIKNEIYGSDDVQAQAKMHSAQALDNSAAAVQQFSQSIWEANFSLDFMAENSDLVKDSIKAQIREQQEYDKLRKEAEIELGILADASTSAAAAVTKFSESLTNVPTGYKLALARYNADAGGSGPLPMGAPVHVKIELDGRDIAAAVVKRVDGIHYNETGSPVS